MSKNIDILMVGEFKEFWEIFLIIIRYFVDIPLTCGYSGDWR